MKETKGHIFSISRDNAPVAGCTISKELVNEAQYQVFYFSLAAGTDISPEIYRQAKLLYVADGTLTVHWPGEEHNLVAGQAIIAPPSVPVGMKSRDGAVYTELTVEEEFLMNIDAGKIFSLAGLVPYQDGKIINRDIIQSPKVKFVVMSFGAGTGLSEHAAPGEALIFCLWKAKPSSAMKAKIAKSKAGENFALPRTAAMPSLPMDPLKWHCCLR